MARCLSAFDSREADEPDSMAPGFYAFPYEDYDREPVGPYATYEEAVQAARKLETPAPTIEGLKATGEFYAAGALAYRNGEACNYGCHYGMRSTRESAIAAFRAGWSAARREAELKRV